MPVLTLAPATPEDMVRFGDWTRADTLEKMTCRPVVDGRRVPPSNDRFMLSCFVAGDPLPVGRVTCFDLNPRNRSAEFGYAVRPDRRGQGVGFAMLQAAFDRLFAEHQFNKLYCQTCISNLGSVRLLEKLGLHRDGILREHHEIDGVLVDDVIYSVLQREWALRRLPGPWQSADYVDHYNRNYAIGSTDIERYLGPLRLAPTDTFVDFGCGEGVALHAAATMARAVVGVDGSPAQLDLARARLRDLPNVTLIAGGFLDCALDNLRFTRGGARKALHHLTDAEKKSFFARVGPHFDPGALFHLEDGVFTFARAEFEHHLPQVLAEAEVYYGERWTTVRADVLTTLRDEFCTGFDAWSEAMAAGGFVVVDRWQNTCFYGGIVARKE